MKTFKEFILESKPRIFYRGEDPNSTERIKTKNSDWDSHFFVSSDKDQARNYAGSDGIIKVYQATPEAKILYQGTKEYNSVTKGIKKNQSLLDYSSAVANRAKESGYHAVHFSLQGTVGTPVFDKTKFEEIKK